MNAVPNKITLNAVTIQKEGFELTMEREETSWLCYMGGILVKRISNDEALGVAVKAVFEGTVTSMR